MKLSLYLIVLFWCQICLAQEIAITFDDAPRGNGFLFTGKERTEILIKALNEVHVPQAAFFCNTKEMDSRDQERLEKYANAGHIIANHTDSHHDLNKIDGTKFIEDLNKADLRLKGFKTFRKWFRFPFLHEGNTLEKMNEVQNYLSENGYINGYVTVRNSDWYLEERFQEALRQKKKINYAILEQTYFDILYEGMVFYDKMAQETLRRSPRHVLLLHENDLAAKYIKSFIIYIRSKGWKVISPEDAYNDEIAKTQPQSLKANHGRISAIALDKGYSKTTIGKWDSESRIDKLIAERKIFQ